MLWFPSASLVRRCAVRPAIIGGIFWKGRYAHRRDLRLGGGVRRLDLYAAPAPFAKSGWLPFTFLSTDCSAQIFSSRRSCSDSRDWTTSTHCLFWSMLVTSGCYVGISLIKWANAVEHGQATVFVDAFRHPAVAPGSRFFGR